MGSCIVGTVGLAVPILNLCGSLGARSRIVVRGPLGKRCRRGQSVRKSKSLGIASGGSSKIDNGRALVTILVAGEPPMATSGVGPRGRGCVRRNGFRKMDWTSL